MTLEIQATFKLLFFQIIFFFLPQDEEIKEITNKREIIKMRSEVCYI